MSSGVGGSRVSIPNNVRKTIQNIREITGKLHADDEIYAVLRECSMDPNETAQKLLYLDTFHEVKRRRDRRKENLNSKASEERSTPGVQRRAARGGGQGNYGSNFSSDAGGGKNAARRDNGVNHTADRGPMSFSQRTKNYAAPRVTKASTCLPNGTANLSNGTSRHGHATKSSVDSEDPCLCDVNKSRPASAQPAALGVTSSSTFVSTETEEQQSDQHFLNPVAGVLSLDSLSTPSVSASMVEDDAGRQQLVAEADHITENKAVSDDNISSGQSEGDKATNGALSQNTSSKPGPSAASQSPSLSAPEGVTSEVAVIAAEVSSQSTSESHVSSGQHVTFPNHFQVPEALKNGLTFGSFDATFEPKVELVGSGVDDNAGAPESSEDSGDASKVPSPSDQNASSTGQGDSLDDNSQSVSHVLEKLQPSEGSTESKVEQSNQDTQYPPEGPQNPPVINGTGTGYGFGIMPPLVGSQFAQVESREAQAHESIVPNLANGNSLAPPSTNASPPLPNSIAVSPQTVPVVRHTYPPNFFPYGQYLSPFYIPPMHQFLSHNGFPAQPSTGNVYLPPAPTGVKFSLPQFKPGNTAGNPTHVGIQPAGSFITAPVGYAQPVTSGSSMGNEDLVASHLKENPIYTTGQLTEGSAVWIHPGQDMPSLQVNSLYNLLPRGHITFSPQQSGHGTFGGMFPPGHAMTAPSTLLQQSQAMAGAIETIGPPSAAYQQPQHGQMNWNTAAF